MFTSRFEITGTLENLSNCSTFDFFSIQMSPAKASTSSETNVPSTTINESVKAVCQTENIKKDETTRKSVEFSVVNDDQHNKNSKICEEKVRSEHTPIQEEILLGSVTTMSSPALRSSARVIQKMKMDSIRPVSPSQNDKKDSKDDRQKTPVQTRPLRVIWTNIERNLFFEALNEFGKDFDAISHYVNAKQRRKSTTDPTYKTKDHVRFIYYQTFHKVIKYLRFSEDIKKHAQELYALINYGEMRKKLVFVNAKACMKLKELVYHGSVSIRLKGKNIRIKTPSCKALRQLNQMEEWQEEIKLPSKVDVYLKPANVDSWSRVQTLAQNPRVKTILPLQKRVLSLLKTFEVRWRCRDIRLCEQTMTLAANLLPTNSKSSANEVKHHIDSETFQTLKNSEPVFCLAPPVDTIIHRPMVNLAEFMSSNSICLNSYEDRIGVTVKGESLCTERLNVLKEIIKTSKRQRHDSGVEKKTIDGKKIKVELDAKVSESTVSSEKKDDTDVPCQSQPELSSPTTFEIDGIKHIESLFDENDKKESFPMDISFNLNNETIDNKDEIKLVGIKEFITSSNDAEIGDDVKNVITEIPRTNETKSNKKKCTKKKTDTRKDNFRPLLNDDVIREIKRGWTVSNVGDLTVGDLYIMFGKDFKVSLEYKWIEPLKVESTVTSDSVVSTDVVLEKKNELGSKLKQLLVLANMTDKVKKKSNCVCGHFCDNRLNKSRNPTEVFPRSFVSNKIYPSSHNDNGLFRQPVLPLRGGLSHIEAYKLSLNSRNKQSRWLKSRNNRPSKQVIVQRILPLQPGMTQSVVTAGMDFMSNGIIRPNGVTSTVSRETSHSSKSFSNNDMGLHKNRKNTEDDDSASTSSAAKMKIETSTEKVDKVDTTNSKADSFIEIIDESQPPPEVQKATENVGDDACIQSIMDLSLPSPISNGNMDEYFSYNNPPMSPMTILRQSPTDPKWFEDNVNDFSLSSFLGHLDSTCEAEKRRKSPNNDADSSNLSSITEGSVDYMTKFEQLAKEMIHQEQTLEK
ncbi:Protein cramped [Pseudolycoriella hygida]|uniref:Protein cramped n=1 Tax=Pseudolycoriella hygida TaxID=35572 RepID=A0A9Q0MT67_9DIPT|nr:Protein cramped [Pseudolycoriella hygida]